MLGCGILMMDIGSSVSMPIALERMREHRLCDFYNTSLLLGGSVPIRWRCHHLPAQDSSQAFCHVADGCLRRRRGGDGAGDLVGLLRVGCRSFSSMVRAELWCELWW